MTERGRLDFLIRRLRRAAEQTADATSDASLLERFVAGRDEAAFELLLWRHGPMVLAVCRRMLRGHQDAEDAFQAAFLLLARKAASIRRREAVAGWLYRTALRIALRARRTARKRPVVIPPGAEPAAPTSEPDVIWRDLRPVLDEEVHRLPVRYRMPIVLCYFQGRTHAEAALELGCPKGTVAVRLQRGRELLRGRLTRRGLAPSAAALAVLAAERTASAAVPAALIHGTVKAALLFAGGKAVAGAASAQAVAWTQGVLKTMFLSKLKMVAVVALVMGGFGTGAGLLLSRTAAAPPAAPPAAVNRTNGKEFVEVPSRLDGLLVLVGTDELGDSPQEDRISLRAPFLALQIDAKDANNPVDLKALPPESQWLFLTMVPDSKFPEACSPARLGKEWDDYRKNPHFPVYRRWHDGDPLLPGKVEVVFEQKVFRKLREGERVKEAQLLALLDATVQVNEVSSKIVKMVTAEADFRAAIKPKEEAIRRAASAEFLWQKGRGDISADDYHVALLNRDRYIEEEKSKDAARQVASEELSASLAILKMCEIRSGDAGIVKTMLKRRGAAVHSLEAVVRLEVLEAAGSDAPAAAPAVNVPSQRDGVLLVVGTEVKEGERVPADRLATVKEGGEVKTYRRLREGDMVEEGQLLARVDGRLARLDLEVAKSKLDAAKAERSAAAKTKEEADRRYQTLDKLHANSAVGEDEFDAAKLNAERYAAEERSKAAGVKVAEEQVAAAQTILEMYEIRNPVRGTVKAVLKSRGEAVKSLETVVQVQPKD